MPSDATLVEQPPTAIDRGEDAIRGPQQPIEIILARQLAELVEVSIVVVDPDGSVLYCNEAAAAIVGRSDDPEEPPVAPWLQEPCTNALRQAGPTHTRVTVPRTDGVPRVMAVTVFPLTGATGHGCGAMAVLWEDTVDE